MTRPLTRGAVRWLPLLAAAALACYTSVPPESEPLARSPMGVHGKIRVDGRPAMNVELLALEEQAYVVLSGGRVLVVPFAAVADATFDRIGRPMYSAHEAPARELRERLISASRFPFGIPPAALAQLLAASSQQAPDTLSGASSR